MSIELFDRYYIEIKKSAKPTLISKRKDFMNLLLKALSEDQEAVRELSLKFGTKLVAKTTNANSTRILVDGEEEYRV